MQELKIIEQREVLGQDFKIYGDFENPLFLAKEIAEVIEHSNSRMMLQGVDENEKVVNNAYTLGGNQEQWFLTEDGLYEVLMQSKKPIAKAFKSEVKSILKEIRKTGSYQKPMTQIEIIAMQSQALLQMERQNNEVKAFAQKTADKLENALDVFTSPLAENWKDETNRKINAMCRNNNLSYSVFKGDLYEELERIVPCDISARQRNLRKRLKQGGSTSKECTAITKIDVIARDDKLKLIFDGIVKKYQAKYI